MKEILTASQVADLLQVHLRTVYKLVREGVIPGRKFGGAWRFSKAEILKMVSGEATQSSKTSNAQNSQGETKSR